MTEIEKAPTTKQTKKDRDDAQHALLLRFVQAAEAMAIHLGRIRRTTDALGILFEKAAAQDDAPRQTPGSRRTTEVGEDVTSANEREHDARCDLARAEALRNKPAGDKADTTKPVPSVPEQGSPQESPAGVSPVTLGFEALPDGPPTMDF